MSEPEEFVIENGILIEYTGKNSKVQIPCGVTSIGEGVFRDYTELTEVIIPDGVTHIGDYAFNSCFFLTKVNLPQSLITIGDCAFEKCSNLEKIIIPSDVREIGELAFSECGSDIVLSDYIEKMSSWSFYDNKNIYCRFGTASFWQLVANGYETVLTDYPEYEIKVYTDENNEHYIKLRRYYGNETNVNIPEVICGIPVRGIIRSAFICCGIESINVPDCIAEIGDNAFSGCRELRSITLGSGLKKIGKKVFSDCENLSVIKVPESNIVYDSRNDCNAIIETATNILVVGCQSTVIPENVVKIGETAFNGMYKITQITIPEGVEIIGEKAFEGCSELNAVTIPKTLRHIGKESFRGCRQLGNINLPDSVSVGPNAFKDVKKVTYNGPLKGAPWGADMLYAPNPVPVKSKEKARPSVSTPFEGKKIVFVGIDLTANPDIKKILKSLGCSVVTKVSKSVDFMVYTKEMVGYSSDYRSAEFQKYNNKKPLWPYDEFLSKLKKYNIDTSTIENAGVLYPIDTPDKKLSSFKKAIGDSINFFHKEEILHFNDDCYETERSYCKRKDVLSFDDNVLDVLAGYGIYGTSHIRPNINEIIDVCGCYECIEKIIALCVATKMFFDPDFECRFRIYRDKYELNGDYYMMYGGYNVPPVLYWEISKEHPFGFVSFVKQH